MTRTGRLVLIFPVGETATTTKASSCGGPTRVSGAAAAFGTSSVPAVVLRPMLLRPGAIPTGAGWAFELKYDGFRAIVSTENGLDVRSRRNWRMADRVPELETWRPLWSARFAVPRGMLRRHGHQRRHGG